MREKQISIGDMVKFRDHTQDRGIGIVVQLDDSHRQTTVDVLFSGDALKVNIWDKHLEVLSES